MSAQNDNFALNHLHNPTMPPQTEIRRRERLERNEEKRLEPFSRWPRTDRRLESMDKSETLQHENDNEKVWPSGLTRKSLGLDFKLDVVAQK